ncbi:MAG: trimeric intracellular cation channel family protein [Actinomycetales bacterium]
MSLIIAVQEVAPNPLPSLPVWLELAAMTANCFFGARLARVRGIPVAGTLLAGLFVGLGGGIFRDMMLNLEPTAIAVWYYIPAGLLAALVAGLLPRNLSRFDTPLLAVNAVVLGLLVTIGAQKALSYNAPLLSAVFLGVITASFGGFLADSMAGQQATIDKQAHWVLSALMTGSAVFVVLSVSTNFLLAEVAGVATVAGFRFFSQYRNWPSPFWPGERPQGRSTS